MSLADITSNLRAPIQTKVGEAPAVRVHSVEWRKVQVSSAMLWGCTASLVHVMGMVSVESGEEEHCVACG